jgi:ABC-2 type transport system ATP-binding protein
LDTPQNLRQRLGRAGKILFDAVVPDARAAAGALRGLAGVRSVEARADGDWTVFEVQAESDNDPREALYNHAVENRWRVREISRPPVTLEEVFAEVTSGEEGR